MRAATFSNRARMVSARARASAVPCSPTWRRRVNRAPANAEKGQPQLVGAHRRARGAVGANSHSCCSLIAVFHVAAGAVQVLVEGLRPGARGAGCW